MEYCDLLDKADECEDPYMRMAYACEFLLLSPTTPPLMLYHGWLSF
jgi:hypothetical protein